ncbi:MAG: hypothetical protein KDC95_10240 [Planctomycetes bacterium]|nr:hypothetical protein [Planctomycetota bacterium]
MTDRTEHAFLGEEFLTWLWYRSETGRATFTLRDRTEVGVSLDDFLCIGGSEDETEQTLRRGLPTRSSEATAALASGKRLVKARLILAAQHDEWTLTLDGPRFACASVRRNSAEEATDSPEARDIERIESFVRVGELLDGIYTIFLEDRLQESFSTSTLSEMRSWVAERANIGSR